MINKVKAYIKKYNLIDAGVHIVIGVSGGADSICLLYVLKELSKEYGCILEAVHVNHMIRGKEADADERYVGKCCEELGIPLQIYSKDIIGMAKEAGITVEEAGRLYRYSVFKEVAGEDGLIAIAHHRNDLVETMLFNMARGSNLRGISGIEPKRDNIIRPLLGVSREEIEEYLSIRGIDYCIDRTNSCVDYSRNRIRHNIVPELEKLNEEAVSHISRLAEVSKAYVDFVDRLADKAYKLCVKEGEAKVNIDVELLKEQEDIIISEVVYKAIVYMSGRAKDIEHIHVTKVCDLMYKTSGKRIDLPYNLQAFREYNYIAIVKKQEDKANLSVDILESGLVYIDDNSFLEVKIFDNYEGYIFPKNVYTKAFDYDRIKDVFQARYPREEDYLVIDKAGHKKKLSRYFIDEKVPDRIRNSTHILAVDNHVIWIIGGRVSEAFKIDDSTRHIVEISYKNTKEE